jgi:sporulation protein YlmC with PRC-barrel domain
VKSIHELLGMALVTVQEGIRLGTVKGVELDPAAGRIAYLCFDGAETRADGVVPWEAVRAVGADAITVASLAQVREAVPGEDRARVTPLASDRPVMTESGTQLGRVTGYDVDETTGHVERYHVATGGFFGRLTHSEISFPHTAVRAFGPDAVVVADEVGGSPEGEKR